MAARATPFISFFASPEMPKAICFQKPLRSVQCTNTQLYLPTTVFDGWNIPVTCELTGQKKKQPAIFNGLQLQIARFGW